MSYNKSIPRKTITCLVVVFIAMGLVSFPCLIGSAAFGQPNALYQEDPNTRLQQKMQQVQELMPGWVEAGGNQSAIVPLGQQIDGYMKAGKLKEVEELIDKLLAIVSNPGKRADSPETTQPRPAIQQGPFIGNLKLVQLGEIPRDAAIIFWSVRYESNRPDMPSLGPSELYVMNMNGGNVTRITYNTSTYHEHAAISFDRKKIVTNRYLKEGNGPTGLWIIDLEKKTEAQLVPDFSSAGNGGVDWSPDGYIYFVGQRQKGRRSFIFKIRPDGTELTQLTSGDPSEPGYESDVSVSENGSLVAYVRVIPKKFKNKRVGKPQIWVMNSDGTNQHMVYDGGSEVGMDASGDIGAFDPEISPDNKQVIFSQTNTAFKNFKQSINTAHDIYIINLDGTGLRRLTQPGPVSIIPGWHDNKILYTEYNEKEQYIGLVIINPDGSGRKQLEPTLKKLWDGGRHGKFLPR